MVRKVLCGLLALIPAILLAQPIGGPRTFPQFRDMAGLCGNGFAVQRDGTVGILGAMTLSTPIAFTLKPGQLVVGAASRSFDSHFRWINTEFGNRSQNSDGTGQ